MSLRGSAVWETLFANLYVSFLVNELFKDSNFSASLSIGDYCPMYILEIKLQG